jgi:hypothetical protein
MTPEAKQLWERVYPELSKDEAGLIGAVTARAEAQTTRLALLYALLDGSAHIDCIHISAARALWDYCETSARRIFADLTGDPLADAILRALRNAGATGMSRSSITSCFGGHGQTSKIQAALGKLLANGKARCELKPAAAGPGRPTEMWFAA